MMLHSDEARAKAAAFAFSPAVQGIAPKAVDEARDLIAGKTEAPGPTMIAEANRIAPRARRGSERQRPEGGPFVDGGGLDEAAIAIRVTAAAGKRNSGVAMFERGDHGEVAELVAGVLHDMTGAPLVYDRGELFAYDPNAGTWRPVDEATVTRIVARLAGAEVKGEKRTTFKASSANADGIARYLRDSARAPYREGFFDAADPGVACSNGFLVFDAATGQVTLRAHHPQNRARESLPFAFDAAAASQRWTRALGAWFEGDTDAADKVAFLQEFVGASLLGAAPRLQRAAVLLGHGANGKSVFVEVVSALFPMTSLTAIPPHEMSNMHTGAGLERALLNAVAECPEREILASDGFKAIVSGDLITRRPAHGRTCSFRPRAGHLIAANRLPHVSDSSHGFWRRVIVVGFERRFAGADCDPALAAGIIADELGGVLAWALAGAARALRAGAYTVPASSGAAVDEWRTGSNAVALWLEDRTDPEPGAYLGTASKTLFVDFQEWARDNGFQAMSATGFGTRMKLLAAFAKTDGVVKYAVRLRDRASAPAFKGWGSGARD